MSAGKDSDRHLESLRSAHTLPITGDDPISRSGELSSLSQSGKTLGANNRRPKKKKGRARPNRNNSQRISVRRIGMPSMTQDAEKARMHFQQLAKAKSRSMHSSNFTNAPQPVSSFSLAGSMPQPETLGNRRRQSAKSFITRKSMHRSRKNSGSSQGSNQSDRPTVANGGDVIIRYGELQKKAVTKNTWNTRFFVLSDRNLCYYEHSFDVPQELRDIEMKPKGKIALALIDEVSMDKNDPKGATFIIATPTRNYRLKMQPIKILDEDNGVNPPMNYAKIGAGQWVNTIRGACENARRHQGLAVGPTRGSFGSFGAYYVDEMDVANSRASMFKHPARRLVDSDMVLKPLTKSAKSTQSGNGVHAPAELGKLVTWTPFDVAAWLHTVHMDEFSELFYKQGIDGKMLQELSTTQEAKRIMGNDTDDEKVMKFLNEVEKLREIDEVDPLLPSVNDKN